MPRRLPAGSTTSKPLANILLDAGTFFTFTRHAGARADGAPIIAAEQAIAEAMRATSAASSLPGRVVGLQGRGANVEDALRGSA